MLGELATTIFGTILTFGSGFLLWIVKKNSTERLKDREQLQMLEMSIKDLKTNQTHGNEIQSLQFSSINQKLDNLSDFKRDYYDTKDVVNTHEIKIKQNTKDINELKERINEK